MKKKLLKFLLILILFLLPLPLGFRGYYLSTLSIILIYAIAGEAWNEIGGMGGQLDLAAASYLGLGAFTWGNLFLAIKIPFWVGVPLAGGVAAGFSVLLGFPTFKFGLREVWYALASIASVVVLNGVFHVWGLIGGSVEEHLPSFQFSLLYMRSETYAPLYYASVVLLVVMVLVSLRIKNSKLGYQLKAIGLEENLAEACGINIRKCKLKALAIYAFFLGIVGAFYVNLLGYIHYSLFNPFFSLVIAIIGIVGGRDVILGPAIAAFILIGLREITRLYLGGIMGGLAWIAYGLVLIVVVLFKPEGIGKMIKGKFQ